MHAQTRKKYLTLVLVSLLTGLCLIPIWFFDADYSSLFQVDWLKHENLDEISFNELAGTPNLRWIPSDHATVGAFEFGTTVHWLKVEIDPRSESLLTNDLILESRFPLLRQITIFLTEDGKLIDHSEGGREIGYHSAVNMDLFANYRFSRGSLARTLYVRTLSDSPNIPDLAVRATHDFQAESKNHYRIMNILAGISVFLILYGLATAIATQEPRTVLAVAMQLCFTAVLGLLLGYDKIFLGSFNIPYEILVKFSLIAYFSGFGLLIRNLWITSKLDRTTPWMVVGYRIAEGLNFGCCILIFAIPASVTLTLAGVITALSATWIILTQVYFGRIQGITWIFLAHWVPFVGLWITSAEIFNLLPHSFYARYAAHLGLIWLGFSYAARNAGDLRIMNARQKKISDAMSKDYKKTALNHLLTSAYDEGETNIEADVSIMFIDIVQFSSITKLYDDIGIYQILSARIRDFVTIVERHGGRIDRSLGDGLLCFFGYADSKLRQHHASDALQAAIDIQKLSVENKFLDNDRGKEIILPVRIGIHSARVVIGNLGTKAHLDFTMIGSGVNLASRMEASCAPFKIMISEATVETLRVAGIDTRHFSSVLIAIKHQRYPIIAYELDPFHATPQTRIAAEQYFFRQNCMNRVGERIPIQNNAVLYIKSEIAEFEVRDFSLYGFGAVASRQLGRGVTISAQLFLRDRALSQQLKRYFLQSIVLEVRWYTAEGAKFRHGLRIIGGSQQRREKLCEILQQNMSLERAEDHTFASLGMPY